MGKEIISAIIFIIALLVIYWLIVQIKKIKVTPDPWDKENIKFDKNDLGICVNCGHPVESRLQHYCPKCDHVTGENTRYIPFVNIKFNYSIFSTIVKKIKKKF